MTKFDTDQVVNVTPLALKCAFDVICGNLKINFVYIEFLLINIFVETSMGLEMNSQNEPNVPYVKAVHE